MMTVLLPADKLSDLIREGLSSPSKCRFELEHLVSPLHCVGEMEGLKALPGKGRDTRHEVWAQIRVR